jgi:hypothetical protein
VPATIVVPNFSGSPSRNFNIIPKVVSAPTTVNITASYGQVTVTKTLTVTPPVLTTLTLTPTTLVGGCGTSAGKIALSGNAPAGGAVVKLTNTNAKAKVPTSITGRRVDGDVHHHHQQRHDAGDRQGDGELQRHLEDARPDGAAGPREHADAVAESGDRRIHGERQRRARMRGNSRRRRRLAGKQQHNGRHADRVQRHDPRGRDQRVVQRPHDEAVREHEPVDPRDGLRREEEHDVDSEAVR